MSKDGCPDDSQWPARAQSRAKPSQHDECLDGVQRRSVGELQHSSQRICLWRKIGRHQLVSNESDQKAEQAAEAEQRESSPRSQAFGGRQSIQASRAKGDSCQPEDQQRRDRDEQQERRFNRSIERSCPIEMTRDTAPRLEGNQGDFDHQGASQNAAEPSCQGTRAKLAENPKARPQCQAGRNPEEGRLAKRQGRVPRLRAEHPDQEMQATGAEEQGDR